MGPKREILQAKRHITGILQYLRCNQNLKTNKKYNLLAFGTSVSLLCLLNDPAENFAHPRFKGAVHNPLRHPKV